MGGEVDLPGIEGKVIAGGVAQTVTREGDLTRIRLTRIPGAKVTRGASPGLVPLPEPVTIEAGCMLVIEMDPGLLAGECATAGLPFHVRPGDVVTTVYANAELTSLVTCGSCTIPP